MHNPCFDDECLAKQEATHQPRFSFFSLGFSASGSHTLKETILTGHCTPPPTSQMLILGERRHNPQHLMRALPHPLPQMHA